jgi:hypothetical protein
VPAPTISLPLPQFAFIVATRAALGVGAGLLLSERIPPRRRRSVGMALVAAGIVTTLPAFGWIRHQIWLRRPGDFEGVKRDDGLVGAHRFARRGDDELSL